MEVLHGAPIEIDWGSGVYAKIIATNAYGDSVESLSGNGAVIITNPDAPVNLVEDASKRTATTLGLQWQDGADNGGSPVTSYTLEMTTVADNLFTVLQSGITQQQFTVADLLYGTSYKFRLQAVNAFDPGAYSAELTLLCATFPVAPAAPVTSVSGNKLVVNWDAPDNRGSPITAYKVLIR